MEPKDWIALGAAIVGALTLIKVALEYRQQNALKRFEVFQVMLKRFNEHPLFDDLAGLCERNDPRLSSFCVAAKTDYAGFFEELALMVNSHLLRIEVVKIMFGDWIEKCDAATYFWSGAGFEKSAYYWKAFSHFAERVRTTTANPERFRF